MKQRCTNPKHERYKDYGGRGIFVCKEWMNNPGLFCAWARQNGYDGVLLLDRIDNAGGYSPENCRFINRSLSGINRRKNPDYCIDYIKFYDGYNVVVQRENIRYSGGFTKDINLARESRDRLVDDLANNRHKTNPELFKIIEKHRSIQKSLR